MLRALVQIKQLAEAGYEDRAKGTFKRWIGNRTPGQIGNKYASEEERQRHYNFNDTLKNVLRMSGKLCFIFGERLFEDESLKKGEEDAEAFFAEGVFEACEDSIDTAGIDKVYQLIKCYYPDDNNKFMDKILLTGKKEIIEYFVNQMGKGMGWTEKVQAAENLLKAKRILGYSGRKEYGGYNLMRWYENISSDKPQVWKSLGIQLFNISGVISETGDNRADVYVDAAIASSAGRCGIKDIIRFSYIPNSKDAQWHQTVFDAIIAYLENGKENKNSLLSLWKCVCRVFPVLEGSSEYSYQNNINTVYREDLKKAILTNAEKNKIVIVEEMKKIKPDCFDKVCKLRETYKIPSRWFEMDDIITYDDSLQECIVKSLQKRNIGSKEWKPIASLLKYAVERGENTYAKEIFSLIMQRSRDYANWENYLGNFRDVAEGLEETVLRNIFRDKVREVLGSLPAEDARLIELLYFAEVTVTDTAKIFGCSRKTIQNRRKRILKELHLKMKGLGIQGGFF